jgi:Protein of unknown function (DUF1580)
MPGAASRGDVAAGLCAEISLQRAISNIGSAIVGFRFKNQYARIAQLFAIATLHGMPQTLVTLRHAAASLPSIRGQKPTHWVTLYRWATVGLISKGGRRVRLKTWRVGNTIMTTAKAIRRFHAELEDAEPKEMPRSVSVTER